MAANLPEGYEEVGRWDPDQTPKLVKRRDFVLMLVVITVIALGTIQLASGISSISLDLRSMALGLVGGLVLHEAAHALAFRAFRARPKFGVGWVLRIPVPHTSAPGYYLGRGRYTVVILAPALGLTVLLLALMALAPAGSVVTIAALAAAIFNGSGAANDARMLQAALSYPRQALFQDTGIGFTVYGPAPAV